MRPELISVGRVPMVLLVGDRYRLRAYATRMSSGAVSPMTRARPRMTPVAIPEKAVGMTTSTTVFHLGSPNAYDASRSESGTSFSISSVDRRTVGSMRRTSARDAAIALRPRPRSVIMSV